MCFRTRYSYIACGCPADKPANKNLCWVHYCPLSMNYSPFRPCDELAQAEPVAAHLPGLCSKCLTKPKHDANAEGFQPAFETEEHRAYKAECLKRRLEKPEEFDWWPRAKGKERED